MRWSSLGVRTCVAQSRRHLGGGERQPGETQIGVGPVGPPRVRVRRAAPRIKFGADQGVNDEPVGRGQPGELAGGNLGETGKVAEDSRADTPTGAPLGNRDQDPCVGELSQCARQRRRHQAQAADLDEVSHLRGYEQHAALGRSRPNPTWFLRPGIIDRRPVHAGLPLDWRGMGFGKTARADGPRDAARRGPPFRSVACYKAGAPPPFGAIAPPRVALAAAQGETLISLVTPITPRILRASASALLRW